MTLAALNMALNKTENIPYYHHFDQGSEYDAYDYIKELEENKIQISMSKKSHPWENGYQESFYSGFKLDFGWPNQFKTWGELIESIYLQINYYNKSRIHTSLKITPIKFREQYYTKLSTINRTPPKTETTCLKKRYLTRILKERLFILCDVNINIVKDIRY